MEENKSQELSGTGYEIFVGALSMLSIINLVMTLFIRDDALRNVVNSIDWLLSLIFLGDFLMRLRRAPSRSDYFVRHFGWADLLASLPFPQVKILRVFRLVRVFRLLRQYGMRRIVASLVKDRAGSALLSLLLIAILVLEFGSLWMLRVESASPDANITTASDALWYIIVTMSTVGYGDQYPVTTAGREIGTFIIVLGVGIFGTLTGFLANFFLAPNKATAPGDGGQAPSTAKQRVQELSDLLAEQQATVAELKTLLGQD